MRWNALERLPFHAVAAAAAAAAAVAVNTPNRLLWIAITRRNVQTGQ